jgi:hypothetical protein
MATKTSVPAVNETVVAVTKLPDPEKQLIGVSEEQLPVKNPI